MQLELDDLGHGRFDGDAVALGGGAQQLVGGEGEGVLLVDDDLNQVLARFVPRSTQLECKYKL